MPARHPSPGPMLRAQQMLSQAPASDLAALCDRLDPALIGAAQRAGVPLVHLVMARLQDSGPSLRERALRSLHRCGADLDACDASGSVPLHEAVRRYDLGGIALLLLLGADRDAVDNQGRTALHVAAECGRISPAAQLISVQADTSCVDHQGRDFLHLADDNFRHRIELLLTTRHTLRLLERKLAVAESGEPVALDDEEPVALPQDR